jgi:DNA-binding NarL/FixJ family response regulator
MDETPITLLVADELSLIREGLSRLCNSFEGCSVIAQCGDGASALQMIELLEPSVAVLDLNLAEVYTLELLRRLRESGTKTRSVVLSTRRDRKTALECIRCGAAGFVLKSGPPEHLENAIQQIRAGAVYVTPLVDLDKPSAESGIVQDPLESLSAREYQVFSLLIDGIRAKEIAARLDLSPKTVDTYRSSLMRKLDIHDVAGLVKFAIQRELTSTRQ